MLRPRDELLATPGADFTFILRKGEMHTWALPVLPEARAMRPQIYEQLLGTDPR
jgi:triacylglycerol lipase